MKKCRKITPQDNQVLFEYFEKLSTETKKKFGPHPFDKQTITSICNGSYRNYIAYICLHDDKVIAYTVVIRGYTEGEEYRYPNYPIERNYETDYTLAPSVADDYQSQGIGSLMYNFVEDELRRLGAKKIALWGGVQLENKKAVRFYQKYGFETLGEFEYNGLQNLDMVKRLK